MSHDERLFDRQGFNWAYTSWMRALHEVTGDLDLVERCDTAVATRLGERMGRILRTSTLGWPSLPPLDSLHIALRQTHWFQEGVVPMVSPSGTLVLGARSCSWQEYWQREHGSWYPQCIRPHAAFLVAFCEQWDRSIDVENLETPAERGGCRWRFTVRQGA